VTKNYTLVYETNMLRFVCKAYVFEFCIRLEKMQKLLMISSQPGTGVLLSPSFDLFKLKGLCLVQLIYSKVMSILIKECDREKWVQFDSRTWTAGNGAS